MTRAVLLNVLMNIVFTVVFVLLNNWALRETLEETFVALALLYGLLVIIANAVYVGVLARKARA